ncbi:MAG: tRNA 2-selenouridine(34) synthase MnmH [Bacteroidia bacterium]
MQSADPPRIPLIDVRSPGEYHHGHIPGAINIPLFDNEERKTVGILYKQKGRESAIAKGLEIVGPKADGFIRQAKELNSGSKLMVHCWRGGMRSESMAWLWSTTGFDVTVLEGGYKAYRQNVLSDFGKPLKLIILGGKTGSGKTAILHALAQEGEQVIDLEGLACHKGSAFGAIGQLPQPTVEQFENDLHQALGKLDAERHIWIEDESHSIGRVYIPQLFYDQMKSAPVHVIEIPLEARVTRLMEEYAGAPKDQLVEALMKIQKRLGGNDVKKAISALDAGDYKTGAEIALHYYDKAYTHGLMQKSPKLIYKLEQGGDNPRATAIQLINFYKND